MFEMHASAIMAYGHSDHATISDLENISQSHDEYLWKVSLKSLQKVKRCHAK